jgi:hypothetical protein
MDGHDRNPVRRNEMNSTIESEKDASAPEIPQPKAKRTPAKKAKPPKKAARVRILPKSITHSPLKPITNLR